MSYWNRRAQPYQPGQTTPFKVSRSKIELFMNCPRCFWLDTRLRLKRPNGPPFQINKAIDELFKKEFDVYRKKGEPHPIMKQYDVAAVPFAHEDMDTWRENFTGVTTVHEPTNLHIFGAVDDVWVNDSGELIVVDYKATAKSKEVTLDADWQIGYKRQMEIYQWLLRQNGFQVNDTGYFVYANGRMDLESFDNKVEFRTKIIPYSGNADWLDDTLLRLKDTLEQESMPEVGSAVMGGPCDFCTYARSRTELTIEALQAKKAKK
jgi:CRISPR/Cas system-associated exonuclease Cas4 (RecB family)